MEYLTLKVIKRKECIIIKFYFKNKNKRNASKKKIKIKMNIKMKEGKKERGTQR